MIETTDTQSKMGSSKKLSVEVVPRHTASLLLHCPTTVHPWTYALHAHRRKQYSKLVNSVTMHI